MASTDPIVAAFDRIAARRGGDAMIVSPVKRWTFGDVDALARSIEIPARRAGQLVGLAAPNGAGFIAGFLALRRAGAAVLLLDPNAPHEDRVRAATAMGAAAILESNGERSLVALPAPAVECTADIGVMKLTSGSTGAPRGVAMQPESLLADEDALARTMGFRDDDRIAASIPMSHSYGFTTVAMSSMVRGLTLVMPSSNSPFAALEASHEFSATIFPTVPSYIGAVVKMSEPPAWPKSIRLVISAGAVLGPATALQFRETYGMPAHVFYGSSECGGICYDREGSAAERGTVGTPVDGVRVSIEPEGEGLVTVESDAVGVTYHPRADARLDSGRFQTSDLATWRNGEVALLRRVDAVINVRGHKVDPSEVERVLATLDGVKEVVVIGVPSRDPREQVVRAIVSCSSRQLDYREIAAWCRARLADHKVPRSVVIVPEIPRTSRGKIDRSALIDLPGAADG
jgi:acyl-coenzyme A synthetase/AMP-(fatty) acid ligase